MRQLSSIELNRLKLLTENSVEVTLIEPTMNGLKKSTMDATGSVRDYLKSNNIHDYHFQKQGESNKIKLDTFLITNDKFIASTASLYRPISKKGDPRIWFKGLGSYANPNDILAITELNEKLYVLNISQINIEKILHSEKSNLFKELVNAINNDSNAIANELLIKLKKIAARGFLPSLINADTSVGRTLETLLEIPINSSRKPDYKGIELKSFRDKRANRKNLFTKVPDWTASKFKSSDEILNSFGYSRENVFRLYCTVSSIVRNSQGLILKVNNQLAQLIENSNKEEIGDFVLWKLEELHNCLLQKHTETFWITAEPRIINGVEHFLYKKAEHTKKPIISQFDILLEQGFITVDHLIKRDKKGRAHEKGPSFKLKPNSLDLLFPPSNVYNLLH